MVEGKGNSGTKRQGQEAAGRSGLKVQKSSGLDGVDGAGAEIWVGRMGKFAGAVSGLGGLRGDGKQRAIGRAAAEPAGADAMGCGGPGRAVARGRQRAAWADRGDRQGGQERSEFGLGVMTR